MTRNTNQQTARSFLKNAILIIAFIMANVISAQNVSISTDGSEPNSNAMLDVKNPATGNGKGILIPRMTETQRTSADAALAGGLLDADGKLRGGEAAQGLLVYQTDGTEGFYYNTSTSTTPEWTYLGVANTDYSNFNSAYTATNSATDSNTASTLVKRDSSGNFSAGTITANLTGNADTATTATNVSGTVAVANGGTGATDAGTARTNLGIGTIATQASNSVDIDGGAVDGVTIGANSAAAGSFTDVTADESNAYYLGTTKVLHRGNGALAGTLVVGSGGGNLTNSGGSEGQHNTFVGIYSGSGCTTGKYNTTLGSSTLYENTTGNANTAIGNYALNSNVIGNYNTAVGHYALKSATTSGCTAVGYYSLTSNTTGNTNTAVGAYSLNDNTTGNQNSAFGYYALDSNTTGANNVAFGTYTLSSVTTSSGNTGLGDNSLYFTTGQHNTAIGCGSGFMTSTGNNNTFNGYNTGMMNSSGANNTFCGYKAGDTNTTGSNNTIIGYNADVSSNNLSNAMALGNGASVDATNKVVIGNSSVTTIGGYAVWSNYSDRREKKEITDCNIGLEFVEKLRAVNFKYKNQDKLCNGFIAQEVEAVCKETNVEFGGLTKPQTENGRYMLSYGEFVVPLVNAVKELKTKNDKLEAENNTLKAENATFKADLKAIKEKLGM